MAASFVFESSHLVATVKVLTSGGNCKNASPSSVHSSAADSMHLLQDWGKAVVSVVYIVA